MDRRGLSCTALILLSLVIGQSTAEEGCGGGISCCAKGFTPGDNIGDGGEYFIQAFQYLTNCQLSCENIYPTQTIGLTESLIETYSSGDGKNKNKCWCEFGAPKLDSSYANYQTCVFSSWSDWSEFGSCSATCGAATKKRDRTCLGGAKCPESSQDIVDCNLSRCAEIEGEIGVGHSFNFDYQSRPSVIGIAVDRKHYTGGDPGCCEKCSRFGRTDLYNYEYDSKMDINFDVNQCRCFTNDRPKFRSKQDGSETRYCGSNSTFLEQVDGTFGVATEFWYKSAQRVGSMLENPSKSSRWIESSEECCKACSNKFPESQMVEYMRSVKMCFCYKAISEKRPKIYLKGTYNGICHNE